MFNPIRLARLQGKIKSNEELAKRLIEESGHLDWPAARAVATKIGDLDRGATVWWSKRPSHAAALAQLLELPLVDLALHSANAEAFQFSTFPELPPLNLAHETPPQIASVVGARGNTEEWDSRFWFDAESSLHWQRGPLTAVCWIHFPPGTGLSLYWAQSRVTSRHEHMHTKRLSDARQRLGKATPVVIRLDAACEDIDLLALAERHPGIAILIIAPFEAPTRHDAPAHESYVSWNYISSAGSSRRIMTLTNPHESLDGIGRFEWQLHRNWQEILIRWVATRMNAATPDTLLSADGVQRWLADFSSSWDAPLLPADILAICRICHHTPETRLPQFSDSSAGRSLLKSVLSLTPGQAMSATLLIEASFRDRSVKWDNALKTEKWASLLPDHTAVPDEAALLAIAQGSSQAVRRELATSLANRLRDASLNALIAGGILAADRHGDLQLQQRFLADLIARDWVIRSIRTEPVENWAMYCYDPDRRRLVDAALAAISLDDLVAVVTKLAAVPVTSPAAIAASDSLFWSVGVRSISDSAIPHALRSLPAMVLARMSPQKDMVPVLWSRPCAGIEQELTWQAICWAWSLGMEVPAEAHEGWAWHFPGWDSDVSWCLSPLWDLEQPSADEPLSHGWTKMLAVSRQFVDKLHQPPGCPPDFLKPMLVAEGLRGRWPVDPEFLRYVLTNVWASTALLDEIEKHGKPLARRLLPLLIDLSMAPQEDQIKSIYFLHSPVRIWALRNTSFADASACLSDDQWRSLWSMPHSLPRHFLLGGLQPAVDRRFVGYEADAIAIGACEASDSAILESLLTDEVLGYAAAARLWEVAPHSAERIMSREAEADVEVVRSLVNAVPAAKIGAATQALKRYPDVFDDADRVGWARARLADSGVHAESVFSLLTMSFKDS